MTGAMVTSTCERFLEITKLKSLLSQKNPKQINRFIKIPESKFVFILQHLQVLLRWVDAGRSVLRAGCTARAHCIKKNKICKNGLKSMQDINPTASTRTLD